MVVWAVTIPAFWYVTPHNAREAGPGSARPARLVGFLARNHAIVLTVWLSALATERFWLS